VAALTQWRTSWLSREGVMAISPSSRTRIRLTWIIGGQVSSLAASLTIVGASSPDLHGDDLRLAQAGARLAPIRGRCRST